MRTSERTALAAIALIASVTMCTACAQVLGYDKDYELGVGGASSGGGAGSGPGGCSPLFPGPLKNPSAIALDTKNVYIGDDVSIVRVPLDGSARSSLTNDVKNSPAMFAANGRIYWASTSAPFAILSAPAEGGATESTDTGATSPIVALAVDATHAYWIPLIGGGGPYTIGRTALTGGKPEAFVSNLQARPMLLHVAADAVYWGTVNKGVYRQAKAGGELSAVVAAQATAVYGVDTDAFATYWVTPGKLVRHLATSFDPNDNQILFGLPEYGPMVDLKLEDGSVYWANAGDPNTNTGQLWRMAVGDASADAGAAQLLRDKLPSPQAIAVDDACVYWVEKESNRLMRAAR